MNTFNELDKKIDKAGITTVLNDMVTDERVPSAKAVDDKIKDTKWKNREVINMKSLVILLMITILGVQLFIMEGIESSFKSVSKDHKECLEENKELKKQIKDDKETIEEIRKTLEEMEQRNIERSNEVLQAISD